MNIQAKGYEASFTRNEAWTLTMLLKHEILSVLTDDHYKHHPMSFKQSCSEKINLFKSFAYVTGQPEIFKETMKTVEKCLAKIHQENQTNG